MSVGLDDKQESVDRRKEKLMCLRFGTDSGRWRGFKVNLNEVSYFEMSGAGKMDLPDNNLPPLVDNAVGNRQRPVNRQRGES